TLPLLKSPRLTSASAEEADISMMSTRPERVIAAMASRYWSRLLKPPLPLGPGAVRPKPMSASLASAMMKSAWRYRPARMRLSFWSRLGADAMELEPVELSRRRGGKERIERPKRKVNRCVLEN